MSARLITIPISHYCERARWALDRAGVEYVEDAHLQLFAGRKALAAGGTKTVPVLVTEDEVLDDSAKILDYAEARAPEGRRLYPEDEAQRSAVRAFEQDIADHFGVDSRLLVYVEMFAWGRPAMRFNGVNAPRWQTWILKAGFPLVKPKMEKYLKIDEAAVARARDAVDKTFDDVAERLSDGREYLFADRFTAADLTFASMAAALLLPPAYGVPLPGLEDLPARFSDLVERYRAQPAGAYALRMFERHRPATRYGGGSASAASAA